jgi:hypothetical protein
MAKGKYHGWLVPDGLLRLEAWARDGLTDRQIAEKIGINERTLNRWKDKHEGICQSLKRGKEVVDIEVENTLIKRAMGFEYTETKVITEEKNGNVTTRTEKTRKVAIPDTTAMIFWLKNRKPKEWRDKPDDSNTAQDSIQILAEVIRESRKNET